VLRELNFLLKKLLVDSNLTPSAVRQLQIC